MDMEIINLVLQAALKVRVPKFDPNCPAIEKIAKLEEHLLLCAWHRGQLEEARYWAIEARKLLNDRWDDIQGWEATLGSKRTGADIDRAKAKIDPECWAGLRDVKVLVDHLAAQITRLGGTDYDAVSRAYTLISGA